MRTFFHWLADKLAPAGWQDEDGFHLGDPPDDDAREVPDLPFLTDEGNDLAAYCEQPSPTPRRGRSETPRGLAATTTNEGRN